MLPELVTHVDIHVYPVISGEYRAYIKEYAHIQAWGMSHSAAIRNLISVLVRYEIPFDFGDAPTRFMN